jgi:hypothetical protein
MRNFKNIARHHEKLGDNTNKPQKHFSNKRDATFLTIMSTMVQLLQFLSLL